MMWKLGLICLIGLLGTNGHAQDNVEDPRLNRLKELAATKARLIPPYPIPRAIVWGPGVNGTGQIETQNRAIFQQILEDAEKRVPQFPPPREKHLFDWGQDKTELEKTKLVLLISSFQDPLVKETLQHLGLQADSFTMVYTDEETGEKTVIVCLVANTLFYDKQMKPRRDLFAAATVELAHALYGDVQNMIEHDVTKIDEKESHRLNVRSYQRTIDFIRRRLEARPRLEGEARDHYQKLLEDEERTLKNLRKTNENAQPAKRADARHPRGQTPAAPVAG